MRKVRQQGRKGIALRRQTRSRHRTQRRPVISPPPRNDLVFLTVPLLQMALPRQLKCRLNRLRPTGNEITAIEISRRQRRDPRCQIQRRLIGKKSRKAIRQCLGLFRHRFGDPFAPMPQRHIPRSGNPINIPPPFLIVEIYPLSPNNNWISLLQISMKQIALIRGHGIAPQKTLMRLSLDPCVTYKSIDGLSEGILAAALQSPEPARDDRRE